MPGCFRYAMNASDAIAPMSGEVEVDECYIGGKIRTGAQTVKPGERQQDHPKAIDNKAPVVSLVQRGGNVRSMTVANVTAKNLKEVLRENVEPTAHVMTDESKVYGFVGKEFERHSTVNHSADEYSRTEPDGTHVSTNTVEGYFSVLKRGVYGSFRFLSGRREFEHSMDEEIRFHLEMKTREYLGAGMSPEEARAAAVRSFGNPRATST